MNKFHYFNFVHCYRRVRPPLSFTFINTCHVTCLELNKLNHQLSKLCIRDTIDTNDTDI